MQSDRWIDKKKKREREIEIGTDIIGKRGRNR